MTSLALRCKRLWLNKISLASQPHVLALIMFFYPQAHVLNKFVMSSRVLLDVLGIFREGLVAQPIALSHGKVLL